MQYDRFFFEKTGYKVTEEPTTLMSKALGKYTDRFQKEVRQPQAGTEAAIRKAIADAPDEPMLYNHLYIALINLDKYVEARQVLRDTLERFPDYPFGKTMLANQRLSDQDPEGAKRALGSTTDIREFLPSQEHLHKSLFTSYSHVAGLIECELGNMDIAKNHLRNLLLLDKDDEKTKILERKVFQKTMVSPLLQKKEARDQLPSVEHIAPEKYEMTDDEPVLHHPEVGELAMLETMPKRVQQTLLALPRETLVADLCALLIDAIQRQEYFEESPDTESSQVIHALSYLAVLKAGEALPVVLDTLRAGPDHLNFWLGDWQEDCFIWYLWSIGEQHWDALQSFAREPNLAWEVKHHVSAAVVQGALHNPELRPRAVQWFADLFQYLLDHEQDTGLIDATFIAFAISEASNLRGVELFPLLEAINQKGWIDPYIMGDWANIQQHFAKPPDPADIGPMPFDLNNFYTNEYQQRRQKSNAPPSGIPSYHTDPVEQRMLSLFSEVLSGANSHADDEEHDDEDDWRYAPSSMYRTKPVETFQRSEPKVGRNDPCPCGSGKKYKKCHGQ
jgi:tetratricopeptide (TPR) repeat protein